MDIDHLIRKHRQSGVLVDANLIVLWVVGLLDRDHVSEFKHTRHFNAEHFDLLAYLLGQFRKHLTTPNILTEASNLLGHLAPHRRRAAMEHLAGVIDQGTERYVPSAQVSRRESCLRLGLTDSGILEKLGRRYLLLTVDLDLYLAVQQRGIDAINFNHLRDWMENRG